MKTAEEQECMILVLGPRIRKDKKKNQKNNQGTSIKSKLALFSSLPQKRLGLVTAFKQQSFNQGVLLIHEENCS